MLKQLSALLLLVVAVSACGNRDSQPPAEGPQLSGARGAFVNDLQPLVQVQGESYPPSTLAERMAYYHAPGLSVAVFRNGEIVFSEGYGVLSAGAGGDGTVNPGTLFAAGPFAMSVVAVAASRMAEQGRIDLDSDLRDRIESLRLPARLDAETAGLGVPDAAVTLRQLLNHIAGYQPAELVRIPGDGAMPTLLETLQGKGDARNPALRMVYRPGLRFDYSEAGYALAQLLLVDGDDADFGQMMRQLVLEPAGMTSSSFAAGAPDGEFARPHDPRGEPVVDLGRAPALAAAGLWTTAGDLARFLIALQGSLEPQQEAPKEQLLGPPAAREVLRSGLSNRGLGFEVLVKNGPRRFQVSGSAPGGHVLGWALQERADGAVILVNGARAEMLTWEVLQAIAREQGWLGLAPSRSSGGDISTLLPLVGTYRFAASVRAGGTLSLSMEGRRLRMVASPGVFPEEDEVEADLLPSEGLYVMADRPQRLRFQWEGQTLAAAVELDGDLASRVQE